MNKNTEVRVREDHNLFPNQIGYFQFYGQGKSKGVAVLSVAPTKDDGSGTLFAVGKKDISPVKETK